MLVIKVVFWSNILNYKDLLVIKDSCLLLSICAGQKSLISSKDFHVLIKDFCWSTILNYKHPLVTKGFCLSLRMFFVSKILNYKHLLVIKDSCVSLRICSCHGGGAGRIQQLFFVNSWADCEYVNMKSNCFSTPLLLV